MDCENLKEAITRLPKGKSVITYSIKDENASIFAKNIRITDRKTIFELYINKELIGEFSLNIPGEHNIQNSLPVIYLALKFGVSKEEIQEALNKFKGSKRRYDVLFDKELENGYGNKTKKVRIIDDYAHHPTEIKATLKAIKSIDTSRLVAIFQPHRYMAFGVAGISIVADSLSAIKYAKVKPIRDENVLSLPCIGLAPGANGSPFFLPSGVVPVFLPLNTQKLNQSEMKTA